MILIYSLVLIVIALYFLIPRTSFNEEGFSASQGCGTGKRTRTVTCKRSDGTIVTGTDTSKCGAMPAVAEPCSDFSRCGYTWETGAWSGCT